MTICSKESTNQTCVYAGGSSTGLRTYPGSTLRMPLSACCKGSTEDKEGESAKCELLLPAVYFILEEGTSITMESLGPWLRWDGTGEI